MGDFDSVDEILEFAIVREVEANEFYMDLSRRLESPAMRELVLEFAKEELEHKAKLELEAMKEGMVVTAAEKVAEFEIADYMSDVELSDDMGYKDLLVLAAKKERRALCLYIDLAAIVENADSREMLLSLAVEEAEHEARFEIEYDEVLLKEK